MGEERPAALIQESLSLATKTNVIKPSELFRMIVDTTVQPKNVTSPTDAKLLNRARRLEAAFAKLLLLAPRVRESNSVNAGRRSIPSTRRETHASARARRIGLTSSAPKHCQHDRLREGRPVRHPCGGATQQSL